MVPAYGAALAAKDAMRAAGLWKERRLRWPVISIGSVSAGGAGKTPVAISIAKLLGERGWTVDVLSRGYGRAGGGVNRVDPRAEDAAHRFGDEPVVIAERAGVPVWVAGSRYAAGRAAESRTSCEVSDAEGRPVESPEDDDEPTTPVCAHILDDGLQHRELARQFDLVLATEADLRDALLPAGNLREPLSALRRADALAVREEELEEVSPQLRTICGPDVPIWTIRRALRFPAPLGIFGAGLRPLAFCALARPENFAAMLAKAGCGVVDTVILPDHHRYGPGEMTVLIRVAKGMQATGLVTTEKDAVKLSPAMRAQLEAEVGPVMVVALEVNFVYESPVVRALEKRLRTAHAENGRLAERVR